MLDELVLLIIRQEVIDAKRLDFESDNTDCNTFVIVSKGAVNTFCSLRPQRILPTKDCLLTLLISDIDINLLVNRLNHIHITCN